MKNWEKRFDELEEDTCGNSDKVFFPFGGDTYDFSSDNCKKFIRNLLLMQRKKIIKDLEYGFEGRETFPACGKCIICRLKEKYNK